MRDEPPHSLAVVVDEMTPRDDRPEHDPMLDIRVNVFVERPSQKAIVIGHKGARLKDVGIRSRRAIEALLGQKVYLDLHVKVAKDWQRDPKQPAASRVLSGSPARRAGPRRLGPCA
ncbi:hypothetical protein GCM10025868_08710 [Angustibacter aerolatus]|uniref:KH type-2 domain-containing protein n=1 Tax=Angustibacter aerolatus TaxID=1162965 RepID=A0ABQ6JDH2_9ACTN|nr:KH domain-containing protein [Angustibacter aerolatus]GMA85621.1 hypothetical protein GCM10025868_08710 [Angustibacter aerolatus]